MPPFNNFSMSKLDHEKNLRKSISTSKNLETSNSDKERSLQQNGGPPEVDRGTDCFSCKKTVSTKDKALQCDCCNFWHHINCEDVSAQTYRNLTTMKEKGVKWYCKKCEVGVQCILTQIVVLNQKQRETDDRLGYIEEKINNLDIIEDRLNRLESRLIEIEKNPTPKTESESKSYAEVTSLGKNDIEKLVEQRTKQKIRESEDKTRRQKNIIIFRLEESSDETQEEKEMEDRINTDRLLREMNVQSVKPVKVFRLKGNEQHKDRARPLKVCFNSQENRDSVLKAFSEIRKQTKDSDDRLCTQVSIRKDMTYDERVADQKLFKELRAKQEVSKNSGDIHAKWIRKAGKVINIGTYPEEGKK